jgi:sensor domain CHASE-containing protein
MVDVTAITLSLITLIALGTVSVLVYVKWKRYKEEQERVLKELETKSISIDNRQDNELQGVYKVLRRIARDDEVVDEETSMFIGESAWLNEYPRGG